MCLKQTSQSTLFQTKTLYCVYGFLAVFCTEIRHVPFGSYGCSVCGHVLHVQKKLKGINSMTMSSQSCWNFMAKTIFC